jgi:hypothetical protein
VATLFSFDFIGGIQKPEPVGSGNGSDPGIPVLCSNDKEAVVRLITALLTALLMPVFDPLAVLLTLAGPRDNWGVR